MTYRPWEKAGLAPALCRLADEKGLPVRLTAKRYKKELPGKGKKLTKQTIIEAEGIERLWEAQLQRDCWAIGGTWNGRSAEL